jgi:hypothetical protein
VGLFRLSPKLDPLPLAWVQLAIAEGAQAIDRGGLRPMAIDLFGLNRDEGGQCLQYKRLAFP